MALPQSGLGRRTHANQRRTTIPRKGTTSHAFTQRHSTMTRLEGRSSDDCSVLSDPNCNKSVTSSSISLPIALGLIIPLAGIAIALFFLHRRHVRKQRAEDAADRHASLDFGLGEVHRKRKGAKGTADAGYEANEKITRQMSMDMATPYLLPPELQNSRESLHSLSRASHNVEDPYRPVTQYLADAGSVRSFRPHHDGSSIYTGSSVPTRFQDSSTAELLGNASRMSRGPSARTNSLATTGNSSPIDPFQSPMQAGTRYSRQLAHKDVPIVQIPAPIATPPPMKMLSSGLPVSPHPELSRSPSPADGPSEEHDVYGLSNGNDESAIDGRSLPASAGINTSVAPLAMPVMPPMDLHFPEASAAPVHPLPLTPMYGQTPDITAAGSASPPKIPLPANPRPQRKLPAPIAQSAVIETVENSGSADTYGGDFQVTPPSPSPAAATSQRYSMDVPPEEFAAAGLGAPGFDARRLSMTFRPLPPVETLAVEEDSEARANRIRSFYKEYFDDSTPAPQGQYYEDYDAHYMPDAAYYDENSYSNVMPYAEPLARRAMTPPPRFQGQGQPGARQMRSGSIGAGNGLPRFNQHMGMRGPHPTRGPAPSFVGSAAGDDRPYSSASNRGPPGPRPGSSASSYRSSKSRGRPLPPPIDLISLPTPSQLKDDSFALFNSADFAPPVSFRDRQAGRSASPLGGDRRPYSPTVPAHRPLLTSFDEMAPLPSPHSFRKSGTFTGLDFAPPRRMFRDDGSASDAGSIRSNRSGVSRMTNDAIRKGAYRVSRLPQDAVPTKDGMADILKPSFGMR